MLGCPIMKRQTGLLVLPLMISLHTQVLSASIIILGVDLDPLLVSLSPISLPGGVRMVVPPSFTMPVAKVASAPTLMAGLEHPVI